MTLRRPARRAKLAGFLPLEDRAVPATFTATINPAANNAGAVAELVSFFNQVNTNGDTNDTVNLFPGGRYVFNDAADPFDGGTALPVFTTINVGEITPNVFSSVTATTLTVNGQGAQFVRPAGAPSFRFLRAQGAIGQTTFEQQTGTQNGQPVTTTVVVNTLVPATMNVNNLSFTGGNVYDFSFLDRATRSRLSEPAGGAIRTDIAQVNVTNAVFDSNTSTLAGGAVYIGPSVGIGTLSTFTNVTFTNNYAGTQGGAVMIDNTGDPVIESTGAFTNSTFSNNLSITGAGAVHGLIATARFTLSTITNNQGDSGGIVASGVTLRQSTLSFNTASGAGTGAVTATEQMLFIDRSTITGNISGRAGAVVGQASGLAVEVISSTIHANQGGNSTIQATRGEVVVAFGTVTNNTSSGGETGGLSVPNNILTISQSVISGNRVPNARSQFSDVQAALFRNLGSNFIGVAPGNFPAVVGPANADIIGRVGSEIDPLLGPLANNGGPTPTRLPAAGSPLLNAVSATVEATRLFTDQRGLPRPAVGADIGAAEVQFGEAQPAPFPLPPPLVPPPSSGSGPLVPPPPPQLVPPVIAVGPGPVAGVRGAPPQQFLLASNSSLPNGTGGSPVPLPPNVAYLLNPDGTIKLQVTPFAAGIPGGIRVTQGDLTGDGVSDLVVGTGPGVSAQVIIYDGLTGAKIATLTPFEASFTGGVFMAVGNLTGTGTPELVVSPDNGGGPRILGYTVAPGATADAPLSFTVFLNFFGINDPNFRGGVRAAIGDVDGDGTGDLIVAAGTGGGPRVSIWDGTTLQNGAYTGNVVPDFFAFEPGLKDGVYVAAGDVNNDGFSDVVIGAGPGGAPRVLVLSGSELAQTGNPVPIANFFAGDSSRRDGVPVATNDLDGVPNADVTVGGGAVSTVLGYFGVNLTAAGTAAAPDVTFDPLAGFDGGVFVG
jgi:predicted outer membrane repeat protein